MKKLALLVLILVSVSANGKASLPKFRSLFEFAPAVGAIRMMQIDLFEVKNQWRAKIKAKLADGQIRKGEVSCRKIAADEFSCRRDDDGGQFTLLLGSQAPRLTFIAFSVADEGEELAADIHSPDSRPFSTEGSKRPLKLRDEF